MIKRYDIDMDGFDNLRYRESLTGEYVNYDDLEAYADEIRREQRNQLQDVREKLCGIELNLCNYDDDDVRELQNNMLEGIAMLDAIMGKE